MDANDDEIADIELYDIQEILLFALREARNNGVRVVEVNENMDEEDDFDDIDDEEMASLYSTDDEEDEHVETDYWNTCNTSHEYTFQPLSLKKINYKCKNDASNIPTERSGHRVVACESNLYSLGGYNPTAVNTVEERGGCVLFQELWCYNIPTNRWKLIMNENSSNDMPRELASNAMVMHNNILISHGGTGFPFGESCSNDCYIYTTGDRPQVKRLEVTGELPTAQYGPGIVLHENYLYTIGGTTGFDYSCDVYRLNLRTKIWESVYICRPEMRDDPEGRYRHEVVYDGNHIYVLGGGTSNAVYTLKKLPAFNLKTNTWDYFNTRPDKYVSALPGIPEVPGSLGYPSPRKCLSCVQHTTSNGDVEAFITGGLQGDFTTSFSDIWRLNLRTKQWTFINTALPKPLYFHSAAHSGNGCMYIFGGIEYNKKDVKRRNDIYKMWMTIPKLSEICWDAIIFYNRKLDRYDRDSLLKLGIPEKFVNRVTPYTGDVDNSDSCDRNVLMHQLRFNVPTRDESTDNSLVSSND